MLAPWWCVNERTTGWVFANAKSATNDQSLSLINSDSEILKKKTSLEIKSTSSIINQLAVNCYKMKLLPKSAQNSHILSQFTNIQSMVLDASGELQNGNIFENSIKLKYITKLTLETMNKLNKLTLEMQPAKDPSNCTGVAEYQLPLAGTMP